MEADLPDGRGYGIRVALADVKGITEAEIARIMAGQPFVDLADFARRAHVSRPVLERLVLAGGFDELHGIGVGGATGSRGRITRRDLLLHVAELDRWREPLAGRPVRTGAARGRSGALAGVGSGSGVAAARSASAGPAVSAPSEAGGGRWTRRPATMSARGPGGASAGAPVTDARALAAAHPQRTSEVLEQQPGVSAGPGTIRAVDVAALAAAQSQAAAPVREADRHTQLVLPLEAPTLSRPSGLPELTGPERVRAELEILGLDASAHIVEHYAPMLAALGVTRSRDLLSARNRSEVWVAGVKVATQTPPIRSGRRVVFLTLDDGTGPSDSTFFEDVQGPYAATVFHSWLLLVRGLVRRTGKRGISLRATGAWELSGLWDAFATGGRPGLLDALAAADAAAHERAELAAAALAQPYAVPRGTGWAEPEALAAAAAADGSPVGDRDDTAYAAPGRPRTQGMGRPGSPARRAGGMGGGSVPAAASAGDAAAAAGSAGTARGTGVGGPAGRPVLVHASGFRQSPYADTRPPGEDTKNAARNAPRKLWHSSPGSSGH